MGFVCRSSRARRQRRGLAAAAPGVSLQHCKTALWTCPYKSETALLVGPLGIHLLKGSPAVIPLTLFGQFFKFSSRRPFGAALFLPDSGQASGELEITALVNELISCSRRAIPFLRWLIAVAVAVAIVRRVWIEHDRLSSYHLSLDPVWLLVSGFCYMAGLLACAGFWWLAMRDGGSRPTVLSAATAYFAGHLGKYVPGKGLVVVIRAALVKGRGVSVALAAMTCAIETLLMMATGGVISAFLLPFLRTPRWGSLMILCAGLAAGFGFLVSPPVASRLGQFAARPLPGHPESQKLRVSWPTLGSGIALMTVAWLCAGLSLAGLLAAQGQLNYLATRLGILKAFALLVLVVSLATVGGFVSLLPGGLGTREWILAKVLAPVIGSSQAIVAAILLRLVWLATEAVGASILWMVNRQWKKRSLQPG